MPRATMPTSRQRGFTLIELVITIVVVGILAIAGSRIFADSYTTVRVVNSSQATANDVRYAVERLAREIREVKYIDLANGYSITSTLAPSSSGMTFVRDINGSDVTVTIARSGSNVTLGYSSPAVVSTLASQVSAFTLDFLDLDETSGTGATAATASKANVRYVVISLTATDATSGQAVTERARVALRNS